MTGSDLIQRLSEKFSAFSQRDVEQAAKIIQTTLLEAMSNGRRIEIRGFGSFCLVYHKPRVARNPSSGETVHVPAKSVPYFKPGKKLRDDVNNSRAAK